MINAAYFQIISYWIGCMEAQGSLPYLKVHNIMYISIVHHWLNLLLIFAVFVREFMIFFQQIVSNRCTVTWNKLLDTLKSRPLNYLLNFKIYQKLMIHQIKNHEHVVILLPMKLWPPSHCLKRRSRSMAGIERYLANKRDYVIRFNLLSLTRQRNCSQGTGNSYPGSYLVWPARTINGQTKLPPIIPAKNTRFPQPCWCWVRKRGLLHCESTHSI